MYVHFHAPFPVSLGPGETIKVGEMLLPHAMPIEYTALSHSLVLSYKQTYTPGSLGSQFENLGQDRSWASQAVAHCG